MDESRDKVGGGSAGSSNRDFQLFWIGSALSMLGSRVSAIAFPLLVLALHGSAFEAGVVGFAGSLPILLLSLHAGALMDRWDRKRVMIFCDVARALLLASIPAALALGKITVVQMAAVAFLQGAFAVFSRLGEPGALRNIVPREELGAAVARVEARERASGLLGQPLGGFLFGLSQAVPFLTDALSYVISVVTLLLIRKPFGGGERRAAGERRSIGAEIWKGISWLWNQHFIRATVLLVAGSNLLFAVLTLMIIVHAERRGASSFSIGLMLSGTGLGGLLGTFVAPWFERRVSKKAVVIGVNWVWAALMPLMAVFDDIFVLGAIYGLMAFVGPIWNVSITTYQIKTTPEQLLGRVGSAAGLVYAGVTPLGSLLGGYLLQSFGTKVTGYAVGASMLLIAVAASLAPSVRHAPDLDAKRGAAPAAEVAPG